MKLTYLGVIGCALTACRSGSSVDSGQVASDAAIFDAASLLDPYTPAPQRGSARCSEIGTGTPEYLYFDLRSDYFDVCGDDTEDADRAFNWTAPASGFYQATAKPAVGSVLLELRQGLCSEDADSVVACGVPIHTEDETLSGVGFYAEAGDRFTMIVDAAENRVGDNHELNKFRLGVEAVDCPGTALAGPLPASAEFHFGERNPTLRDVSCRDTSTRNQRSAWFVAPQTDSYRFSVAASPDAIGVAQFSLLLAADNCGGEELACAANPGDDDLEMIVDLEQGQKVIALLDGNVGEVEERETVTLTVDVATPTETDAGR